MLKTEFPNCRIIGLVGEKRSGKDTVFGFIQKKIPPARRIAFADPLKQELAAACGCTLDDIEANKSIFRLGLQWWGTEFRRQFHDDDYWLKRAHNSIYRLTLEGSTVIVITDVRFPNEAEFVRNLGGWLWRVKRPKSIWSWIMSWLRWQHSSETLQRSIKVDDTIVNGGSLQDLEDSVGALVNEMILCGEIPVTSNEPIPLP